MASINGKWMAYVGSYDGTLYALPIAEQMAGVGFGERSNRSFWISFPVALSFVVALAVFLTRRRRRRSTPRCRPAWVGTR